MGPVDYLKVLKTHWRVVGVLAVLATGAVFLVSPAEAPRPHRAEHVLLLESASGREEVATIANVQVAALRVGDGEVPVRAARILGHEGDDGEPTAVAAQLAEQVEATGNRDLETVTVVATDTDPLQAVRLANAFALALVELVEDMEEKRQEREVEEPSQRIVDIEKRLSEIELARLNGAPPEMSAGLRAEETQLRRELVRREAEVAAAGGAVRYGTLAEATSATPGTVLFASRWQRMLLAAVVAVVLGIGVALVLDRNDTRLRTTEQVEQTFGLPVLTEVPLLGLRDRGSAAVGSFQREPRVAEAFRSLRTALLLFPGADGGAKGTKATRGAKGTKGANRSNGASLRQLVVVTSPEPGDGKSSTATNLALAYAEAGHSALILCWDLWRPMSLAVLGAVNGPGVTDYLLDEKPSLSDYIQETSLPRVSVVPAGTRRFGHSGSIDAAKGLLEEARGLANVVIVDTAPMLSVSMTRELATLADAVVVVCRAGRTTTDAGRRCAELLQRIGAPALGVVMVGVPTGAFADYYGPARAHARKGIDGPHPPSPAGSTTAAAGEGVHENPRETV